MANDCLEKDLLAARSLISIRLEELQDRCMLIRIELDDEDAKLGIDEYEKLDERRLDLAYQILALKRAIKGIDDFLEEL